MNWNKRFTHKDGWTTDTLTGVRWNFGDYGVTMQSPSPMERLRASIRRGIDAIRRARRIRRKQAATSPEWRRNVLKHRLLAMHQAPLPPSAGEVDMSERGSFVTEYIYCPQCLEACWKVLGKREKDLNGTRIQSWADNEWDLPIIAGKIGELYSGGELVAFMHVLAPEIAKGICHPVRVAVLADHGQDIYQVTPGIEEPQKWNGQEWVES